jgi:hypothetical protein
MTRQLELSGSRSIVRVRMIVKKPDLTKHPLQRAGNRSRHQGQGHGRVSSPRILELPALEGLQDEATGGSRKSKSWVSPLNAMWDA